MVHGFGSSGQDLSSVHERYANLLTALRQFTPEKRKELALALPEALPSDERFASLMKNEINAAEEEQNSAHGAERTYRRSAGKMQSSGHRGDPRHFFNLSGHSPETSRHAVFMDERCAARYSRWQFIPVA